MPLLRVTRAVTCAPVAVVAKAGAARAGPPLACELLNPWNTNKFDCESAPTSHPLFNATRWFKPSGVIKATPAGDEMLTWLKFDQTTIESTLGAIGSYPTVH